MSSLWLEDVSCMLSSEQQSSLYKTVLQLTACTVGTLSLEWNLTTPFRVHQKRLLPPYEREFAIRMVGSNPTPYISSVV